MSRIRRNRPNSRVQFTVDTNLDTGLIHLERCEDVIEAHIGLLMNHHTYSVEIPVTHSLGTSITAQHPQHNLYIRVEAVKPTTTQDGLLSPGGKSTECYKTMVTVHVQTIKEGSIAENFELQASGGGGDEDSAGVMTVLVTAKVLHSNQGNPLLKDGVHVLSHEHQDESEYTEWPGHGNTDNDNDPDDD